MDEAEILKMIKERPEKGMRMLMEAYTKTIYCTVSQRLKTHFPKEDIEDCVEDVFVDFYFHIHNYQPEKGSLQGYLRVMAAHKADDRLRIYYKEENKVSFESMPLEFQPQSACYTDLYLIQQERDAFLLETIGKLGETDHEIIMRKYYFGESSRSIAKRLSMSVSAVNTRAVRILRKLRTQIEEKGYQFDDFG